MTALPINVSSYRATDYYGKQTEAGLRPLKYSNRWETIVRDAETQQLVDEHTKSLALYHYASCWFCGQVRNVIGQLNLDIELRDILRDATNRQTLIEQGGSSTVPCLRIENPDGTIKWMYESADICEYLKERFS